MAPQLLEDTTYHTRTPCNTLVSSHTAGTLMGGAGKAEMLQDDYLQEIHLPRLPGHIGQANALVLVRNSSTSMTGTITQTSPGCTGHCQVSHQSATLEVSHRSATLDVQVTKQTAKPSSLSENPNSPHRWQ